MVRQCPHVLLLPVRMSPDGARELGADVGASLGDRPNGGGARSSCPRTAASADLCGPGRSRRQAAEYPLEGRLKQECGKAKHMPQRLLSVGDKQNAEVSVATDTLRSHSGRDCEPVPTVRHGKDASATGTWAAEITSSF